MEVKSASERVSDHSTIQMETQKTDEDGGVEAKRCTSETSLKSWEREKEARIEYSRTFPRLVEKINSATEESAQDTCRDTKKEFLNPWKT